MFKRLLSSAALSLFLINAAHSAEYILEYNEDLKGNILNIVGMIESNDYAKWQESLAKSKYPIKVVSLNSPGGSVDEGLKIAYDVHKLGFDTAVLPSLTKEEVQAGKQQVLCMSICAVISLAGKNKYMAYNSLIGIHSAFEIQKDKNGKEKRVVGKQAVKANALITHFFGKLGLPIEISLTWVATEPQSMVLVTPEANKLYNIGYVVISKEELQ